MDISLCPFVIYRLNILYFKTRPCFGHPRFGLTNESNLIFNIVKGAG